MKLGLGLYRRMLTSENFRFAKQAGATHIVAQMIDLCAVSDDLSTATGSGLLGISDDRDGIWSYEELRDLRAAVEAEGLQLAALENIDPAHWYDVLLDGPRKLEQLENLKTSIRNAGKAGIPCIGYYFSVAGVFGRTSSFAARGGARSVGYIEADAPKQTPIPHGEVWNFSYDAEAAPGTVPPVGRKEMWERLRSFLEAVIPVAEEAGVQLAAHPDDPPLPELRGAARLVYQPTHFQQLLDLQPSPSNVLELCLGTLAEMTEGDVYDVVDRYSSQGKIGFVHCRNVRGKAPNYHEVFIDEGDVDVPRVLQILKKNGYDGVITPDHTPLMQCAAPWHAGMAYALGYLRATMEAIG